MSDIELKPERKKHTRGTAHPELFEQYCLQKYGGRKITSPITGERLVVEGMGDLCWQNLDREDQYLALHNGWGWGIRHQRGGKEQYPGVLYRPTVREWLTSKGRYLALWGGFDTGKTYAACLAATQMAICFPGSKTVFFRDTYEQLTSTTLWTLTKKLWQDLGLVEGRHWKHRAGDKFRYYEIYVRGTVSYIYYRSMPEKGVSLDKLVAGQKSFEPDRIIIEESALLDQRFFWTVSRRIDRGDKSIPPWARKFLILGNPPPHGSWMYDVFRDKVYPSDQKERGRPLPDSDNYGQWVTTAYDNRSAVTQDEIRSLETLPEDFKQIFLYGEGGKELIGTPVFAKQYKDELHASYERLPFYPHLPLYRGWDLDATGTTICCIVCQRDPQGTLNVLEEVIFPRVSIGTLVDEVLSVCNRHYHVKDEVLLENVDGCDPAFETPSNVSSGADRVSPKEIMEEKGLAPVAGEKQLPGRLHCMDQLLERLVSGQPAIRIDVQRCPILHLGFRETYVYGKSPKGVRTVPLKNEYSHIQDALQYIATRIYKFDLDPNKKRKVDEQLRVVEQRLQSRVGLGKPFPLPAVNYNSEDSYTPRIR